MGILDDEDLKEKLLIEWIESLHDFDNSYKTFIYKLGKIYRNELTFLYSINATIINGKEEIIDSKKGVRYKKSDKGCTITIKDKEMEFSTKDAKSIISGLINICEDILPVGSVVKLKNNYLKNFIQNSGLQDVEVVIISKYIFLNSLKTYYEYGAVAYPVGKIGKEKCIYFTSALIDEVLFRGYETEKDNVYNYLMKNELIVQKEMRSIGFVSEDVRDEFLKKMKEGR